MSFKPTTFGRYALLKRIAIGGMAEVFRAMSYGAEGFEKLVAIKRMLPHMSRDAQFLDMFINEAKLAALLNHSNIVQIYDFGSIDKQLYLAMEYVHGQDLAHIIFRLREGGFAAPVELVCYLLIQVLHALQYAHQPRSRGGRKLRLVHRDISPPNIIVSYSGEIKLADFGIAKAVRETSNTGTGILKGKYCYMSPEQAGGGQLDHRTDLFSLGICFYELLTLEDMFPGNSELEILERVRAADFVKPRQHNPSIPRKLEAILLRALRRDPKERYANAAEFRDAVEKFLIEKNYRFSANWLADFMRDIFGDEIDKAQQELDAEAALAEDLRPDPVRLAAIETEMEEEVETLTGQRPELWNIDTGTRGEDEEEEDDAEASTVMVDRDALGLDEQTVATSDHEVTLEADSFRSGEEDSVESDSYSVRLDQPTDKDLRPLGQGLPVPPLDEPAEDAEPSLSPPAEPELEVPDARPQEDWFSSLPGGEHAVAEEAQATSQEPADLIGLEGVAPPAPPAEPPAAMLDGPDLDDQPEAKKREFPFGWLFFFLLLAVGAVAVFALDLFGESSSAGTGEGDPGTMAPLGEPANTPPDGGTTIEALPESEDAGTAEKIAAGGQDGGGGQTEPAVDGAQQAAADGGATSGEQREGKGRPDDESSGPDETVAAGNGGDEPGAGQKEPDGQGAEQPAPEEEKTDEGGKEGGETETTAAGRQIEIDKKESAADEQPDPEKSKVVAKHGKRKPDKPVRTRPGKKTARRRRRRLPRKRVKSGRRRRRTTSRARRGRRRRPTGVPRDLGGPPYLFVDGKRVKSTRALSRRLDPGLHTLELRDEKGRIVRKWQVRVSAD